VETSSIEEEVGQDLELHVINMDDFCMLLAIQITPIDKKRRDTVENYDLFVKTEEGLKKVSRVFIEFEEEINDSFKKE
jgi:hypothetical protein